MTGSKVSILAPFCAVIFVGAVSIPLILYYYNQSSNVEKETQQLEKSLNRLQESIREWQRKPLSNEAKDNIVGLVDRELDKCETAAPLSSNVKVLMSLEEGDNRTMEKYLKVRKPMAHLTPNSKPYQQKHEKEKTVSYWKLDESGNTYLCNGVQFHKNHLIIHQTGAYYVYSQLKYRYKPSESEHLHRHVTYLRNGKKTISILENSYLLGKHSGLHGDVKGIMSPKTRTVS